jgi:hypothetical protein
MTNITGGKRNKRGRIINMASITRYYIVKRSDLSKIFQVIFVTFVTTRPSAGRAQNLIEISIIIL